MLTIYAPLYLGPFTYVADLQSRFALRFSCSDCLVKPPVRCFTIGNRPFSVACCHWRLSRRSRDVRNTANKTMMAPTGH